jgi:pantothenate kinase type III
MSVLTIDIGNTRGKFAVISQEGILLSFGYLKVLESGLGEVKQICEQSLKSADPIHSIVYSTVKKDNFDWKFWDLENYYPVELKSLMLKFPFQVDIDQPQTLGSDRLAGVLGCMYFLDQFNSNELNNLEDRLSDIRNSNSDNFLEITQVENYRTSWQKLNSARNFMMIDAGTCITYDYVSCDGGNFMSVYYGGAISPGLRLRFKSMSDYTDALPMIEVPNNIIEGGDFGDIGKHTVEAMNSGVVMGFLDEISGRIDRFKEKFVDSQVFLTGGDADFLGKRLKSGIFVEPMLLHYGLFYADQFKR